MKMRHNRVLAISIMVCGVLVIFSGLIAKSFPPIFIGFFNITISILMMVKPQLIVHRSRVELKNLLGFTVKTKEFEFPGQLEIENSVLYVNRNGKREKIMAISNFLSNPRDISALKYFIAMQEALTPVQR